jgi:hypothetical protein
MKLLFTMAHWHGLAKLRLHTDYTLDTLDNLTTILGNQLRDFAENICPKYQTQELPREVGARDRRRAKNKSSDTAGGRKGKQFNLNTYKFHSLGDYVKTIRTYGTTDSYTTELVSGSGQNNLK